MHVSELGSQLVLPFGESGDLLGPGWRTQVAGRQEVRTSFLPSCLPHNGLGVLKTESQDKSPLLQLLLLSRSEEKRMAIQSIFNATMHCNQFWIRGHFSQQPRRLLCGPPQGGAGGVWKRAECGTLGPRSYRGSLPTRSTRDPTSVPRMRRLRPRETKLARAFERMSYLPR